jgi:NADPH2:quinone reductase
MRALVASPGQPLGIGISEVENPTPGPGELLVRMRAASVNRGEVRNAAGRPPGSVLGWDVAGEVLALGDGVQDFTVGQKIVGIVPGQGSFAEQVRLPSAWATPIPDGCSFEMAACLPVAGITAWHVLALAGLRRGQRVLVTGGAGGVGLFAVQLAARAGLDVFAQVRDAGRGHAVMEAGARILWIHPGDGSPPSMQTRFEAILDGVGGPLVPVLLDVLAPKGTLVLYGNSADAESRFRVERLYAKGVTVRGFRLFDSLTPREAMGTLAGLCDEVVKARLEVTVSARVSLLEAPKVLAEFYQRQHVGKIVLVG